MTCRYEIYPTLNLLLLRHEGHTRAKEQRETMRELSKHPDYDAGMWLLIDTSAVLSSDFELTTLLNRRVRHLEQLSEIREGTRWSYYAPTELGYGLCRRAQIMFEDLPNLEIGVFRDPMSALDYLDLTPDTLPDWPAPSPTPARGAEDAGRP